MFRWAASPLNVVIAFIGMCFGVAACWIISWWWLVFVFDSHFSSFFEELVEEPVKEPVQEVAACVERFFGFFVCHLCLGAPSCSLWDKQSRAWIRQDAFLLWQSSLQLLQRKRPGKFLGVDRCLSTLLVGTSIPWHSLAFLGIPWHSLAWPALVLNAVSFLSRSSVQSMVSVQQ
jgi:hypothetical protein